MPACAAGCWPGPTPAAATAPPSAATSAPATASTGRWPTSPRPTPTRPRPTTRPSPAGWTVSAPGIRVGLAARTARTNGEETKDDPVDPGHVGVRGHPGVHARACLHRPGAPPPRPADPLTAVRAQAGRP